MEIMIFYCPEVQRMMIKMSSFYSPTAVIKIMKRMFWNAGEDYHEGGEVPGGADGYKIVSQCVESHGRDTVLTECSYKYTIEDLYGVTDEMKLRKNIY